MLIIINKLIYIVIYIEYFMYLPLKGYYYSLKLHDLLKFYISNSTNNYIFKTKLGLSQN